MSVRVLLFVQSDFQRPVSRGVVRVEQPGLTYSSNPPIVHYTMTPAQLQARSDAGFWWVVECHSAADGRALVYRHASFLGVPPVGARWQREWMQAKAMALVNGQVVDWGARHLGVRR